VPIVLDHGDFELVYMTLILLDLYLLLLTDLEVFLGLKLILLKCYNLEFFLLHDSLLLFKLVYHTLDNLLVNTLLNHNGIYFCTMLKLQFINETLKFIMRDLDKFIVFLFASVRLFELNIVKDVYIF
jgi:hypothetical protein